MAVEKPFLLALSTIPEYIHYHISVVKMLYSIPYEYIKHRVDVRMTREAIEVFYRICSHPRLHGKPGQYSIVEDHMHENHMQFIQWNANHFISWAQIRPRWNQDLSTNTLVAAI